MTDRQKSKKKTSFSVVTLGCKVNQFESESISQKLIQSGYTLIPRTTSSGHSHTDTCIINTCTVTQKASMQSRQAIRQAIRTYPAAKIIVTGCLAQTAPEEIAEIEGIHQIIGHDQKQSIPALIQSSFGQDVPMDQENDFPRIQSPESTASFRSGRTRPFLKIQDGCDTLCSYCIVPYARGRHRSMPFEDVITSVGNIQAAGLHEVVLTGIHLGCYGTDLKPKSSLCQLLVSLSAQTRIDRIRLSSIEPLEITDDLIQCVVAASKTPGHICRHFHIPLQSGDDTILQQMRRPYNRRSFIQRVEAIHHALPQAAIGVDVMIGFPGEDDQAYQNTIALIEQLPITYLHVFPFSPRRGTPASRLAHQIAPDVIKKRCAEIRGLGEQKRLFFLENQINSEIEVLVESTPDKNTGRLKGVSSNYIKVLLDKQESELKNTLQKVRLVDIRDNQIMLGIISD